MRCAWRGIVTERFTVYDIFGILVPGAIFLLLLVTTLSYLVGSPAGDPLVDWTGGFGDATVLVIAGYGVGVLLQTIGAAVTGSKLWRDRRGGYARVNLLIAETTTYTETLRVEVLDALVQRYGELPEPGDAKHQRRLQEVTYRAYKHVRASDPDAGRLFAEHHQMRAYAVAFALLAIIAMVSIPFGNLRPCLIHMAIAVGYGSLAWLFTKRMEKKDNELAHHVHARFTDDVKFESVSSQGKDT